MKKNIKNIFFVSLLILLLVGITAVSAADDTTDTCISEVSTETNVEQSTTASISDQTIKNIKTINKKTNKDNNKINTKNAKIHIVNNDTVKNIFNKAGKSSYDIVEGFNASLLSDDINDGDTLDFQGTITGDYNLTINKAVNIITSTNDALINLNTTREDLVGSNPGNHFIINREGSYTNITGIKFYNTQLFLVNTTHVVLDHIDATVNGNLVGGGVGQTSIRANSSYITVKNSNFYTNDNGGSSTFVLAWANHCNIINNTINAEGNSGNLFYFTTANVRIPTDEEYNSHNRIINNTIGVKGQSFGGIQLACVLTGGDNYFEGNYIAGAVSQQQIIASTLGSKTFINNVVDGTILTSDNDVLENNTFMGGNVQGSNITIINNNIDGKLTLNVRSINPTIKNNNCSVTMGLSNFVLSENNIKDITISARNVTVQDCNITGLITIAGTGNYILNNNINSTEDKAMNIRGRQNTIANNTIYSRTLAGTDAIQTVTGNTIIDNTPEPGQTFNITDETYSNFFNNNGVFKNNVGNYSTIILNDEFINKDFIFEDVIINVVGKNVILKNSSLQSNKDSKIAVHNISIVNENTNKKALEFKGYSSLYTSNITLKNNKNNIITLKGEKNKIDNNKFNITNLNEYCMVDIEGDNNNFTKNNIYINDDENVKAITLNSNKTLNGNTLMSNQITISSKANVQVFDINNTKETNVKQNTLNITSSINTNSILINNTSQSTISDNNIYINAENNTEAIRSTSFNNKNNDINSNTLYINSKSAEIIIIENSDGTTLEQNRIFSNTTTSRGIILNNPKTKRIQYNQLYLNNTKSSDDFDNMNTAYYLKNVDSITNTQSGSITTLGFSTGQTTVNNSAGIIFDNVTNLYSSSIGTINTSSNNNVYFINSNNNSISSFSGFYTTSNNTVSFINSSNNQIYNSVLVINYEYGGIDTIYEDKNSHNNTFTDIHPSIMRLTNDNYNEYFDENNTIRDNQTEYIAIASDIYNKTLIINCFITNMHNLANYTLYNTTIITEDSLTLNNININNTDKTAIIIQPNKSNRNYQILNSTIISSGNNKTTIIVNYTNTTYIKPTIKDSTIINYANNIFIENIGNTIVDIENNNITIENEKGTLTQYESIINLKGNNLNVKSKNFTVITGMTGAYLYNNNITINADYVTLINTTGGSNNIITNNNFTIKNNKTNELINMKNTTYTSIENNNILVQSNYDTPFIKITPKTETTQTNSVKNNYLMTYTITGDDCVAITDKVTIENNKPTGIGYKVIINIKLPERITVNQENNIQINTTDSLERIIPGTIILTDGNTTITSDNGNYAYTPTETGEKTLRITYNDTTGKYENKTETIKINIEKITTSIDLTTPTENTVNKSTPITIIFTDENGKIIKDSQINMTTNNQTETLNLKNGVLIYNYTPTTIGEETIIFNFEGNSIYEATTKEITLTVTPDKDAIIKELNNTVQEQTETIDELNNTVNSQDKTIQELEQNMTEANSKIDSLNNNVTKLNNQVKDLTNENKQLKDNLTQANNKIATQDKTIQDLNKSLTDANKALADANKQIKDLNSTVAKLNDQIKNMTTPLDTKITINTITAVKYNSDVKITGTLTDKTGNTIKNTAVTLNINGKANNVATDNKGTYTYTGKATKVGTNNVTVQYVASDKYNAAKATSTFKVNKQDLKITINNITSDAYKEDITVTGVFTDATGKGLSNTNLNLTINDKTVKVRTTTDGVFTYTTKATKVGTNNLTVTYAGNANYNKVTTKTTFKVVKQDLIVTIDNLDDVRFKENITISGKFVDGNAKPIGNTKLTINLNGKKYTVKTNAQGVYKRSIRVTQIDTNNVTVTYAGNANYNKATQKTTFKAIKQNLGITLDSVKTGNGKITVTGTFTDEESKPLMNSNVKVTINNKTYTAKTNNKGVYTLTKTCKASNITLTLSYPGNKNYNSFTKTTKLTV